MTWIKVSKCKSQIILRTLHKAVSDFLTLIQILNLWLISITHICPNLEVPENSSTFFFFFNFAILYSFCHTLTWVRHGCTCVPHPEPPSHLPPHPIPLCHPSAPALSTLYHASNLDWLSVSHMIIYIFQCHSPISSHPCPLPQSLKDCSIHLCLFCCLTYRVIVTIFLNSIYMC